MSMEINSTNSGVTSQIMDLKTSTPGVTRKEEIKTGFKNTNDYSKYLQEKYSYMNTGKTSMQGVPVTVSVSGAFLKKCMDNPEKAALIDRSVMQKACGDEKTAKWLEENLAIMPDVIRNAQKAAISHGSKLISVEFKFTNNGTEMTTCGIFGETGTDSEIDKWLERMKEDKEKEDKKTENMIAIEATTKNKVGFDTYA